MEKLAIIIPAYKSTFLENTLESIARQTDKNFTLYIGDDNSPHNIYSIIDKYRNKINIVYKRFDSNLGGKDLVAQWERCIDMNQGEEWLWLFSDDDVMEENCVKEFYNTIKNNSEAGLIHFNISCLNDRTKKVELLPSFPKKCSTQFYIDEKLRGNIISFVVEFIVHKDIFYSCGRFQNYDLAWGSDFISWIKFSDVANGIVTCNNAKVQWRKSDENISPNKDNPILYRKIVSTVNYTKWILDFTVKNKYGRKLFYAKFPLGEIVRYRHLLTKDQKITLINLYISAMKPSFVFKFFITCFKLFI